MSEKSEGDELQLLLDSALFTRVRGVFDLIKEAAHRAHRAANEITLVAATKQQTADTIDAYVQICTHLGLSQPVIGENYLQEFLSKKASLVTFPTTHYIGPVQSNKAKLIAEHFDLVESVGRRSVLRELIKGAVSRTSPLPIFLQINVSHDEEKQGFEPDELEELLEKDILPHSSLVVRGLMTITRYYEDREVVRDDFRSMVELRKTLLAGSVVPQLLKGSPLLLSMGMSRDYDIAIEEGADIVRVGTALFGERVKRGL